MLVAQPLCTIWLILVNFKCQGQALTGSDDARALYLNIQYEKKKDVSHPQTIFCEEESSSINTSIAVQPFRTRFFLTRCNCFFSFFSSILIFSVYFWHHVFPGKSCTADRALTRGMSVAVLNLSPVIFQSHIVSLSNHRLHIDLLTHIIHVEYKDRQSHYNASHGNRRQHGAGDSLVADECRREVYSGGSIFLVRRHESRSHTPLRKEVEEVLSWLVWESSDQIKSKEKMDVCVRYSRIRANNDIYLDPYLWVPRIASEGLGKLH